MAEIILTEQDRAKTVSATVEDRVVVRLPENPTTGYRWAVDKLDDQLTFESSDYQSTSGGLAGGGGEVTMVFVANQPGDALLVLKHWQSWEGDQSITDRFTVTVKIAAP